MRVLALDYGSARCGLAVSDPTGMVAARLERERRRSGQAGEPQVPGDGEVPSGTKRVSRLTRRSAPRKPVRPKRRHSWAVRVISLLALIVAAAVIWFLVELFQPFHRS